MTLVEFSDQFDLLFNNITSNQAPGLSEFEKSVFLTKAQDEVVKNYFTANSKGNNIGQGFDDSAKRQADFSALMRTKSLTSTASLGGDDEVVNYQWYNEKDDEWVTEEFSADRIDERSRVFPFPADVFIVVNESISATVESKKRIFQVIPLKYDEYTRLMSKPFKRPLKYQAWRLINSGNVDAGNNYIKSAEIITTPEYDNAALTYRIRYVTRPYPIILSNLDGLTINGKTEAKECMLDPILHEDILQRAVELAKVAWTQTGQDNSQAVIQAGLRSE